MLFAGFFLKNFRGTFQEKKYEYIQVFAHFIPAPHDYMNRKIVELEKN